MFGFILTENDLTVRVEIVVVVDIVVDIVIVEIVSQNSDCSDRQSLNRDC